MEINLIYHKVISVINSCETTNKEIGLNQLKSAGNYAANFLNFLQNNKIENKYIEKYRQNINSLIEIKHKDIMGQCVH